MKRLLFRRGFMDKLYYYNFRAVWIFTGACFILNALSGVLNIADLSIISYGIPAAWAELGVHTGFIVWKAKEENCRKYKFGTDGKTKGTEIGSCTGATESEEEL